MHTFLQIKFSDRREPTGFTLVELLVVVAIIALLLSIIIPVLGNVRVKARTLGCASQLREIGKGMYLYLDDHDDHFPGFGAGASDRWLHAVAPYVGVSDFRNAYSDKIFHCTLTPFSEYQTADGRGDGDGCYGINEQLLTSNTNTDTPGVSYTIVTNSSATVLIADKSYLSYKGIGNSGPHLSSSNPFPASGSGAAANHRRDGSPDADPNGAGPCNYLFVDGHVRTLEEWPGEDSFTP